MVPSYPSARVVLNVLIIVQLIESISSFSQSPPTIRTSCSSKLFMSKRTAAAPKHYIRLQSRTSRGNNNQCFDLQTAVTTFEKKGKRIDLHAQIHFGTRNYFEYINSALGNNENNSVHYELLVDEELMEYDDEKGYRRMKQSSEGQGRQVVFASSSDEATAQQYGLESQVNMLDYTQHNWIHADLTRQEFRALLDNESKQPQQQSSQQQQPLWALASTSATWPGAEAISAIFEPYYNSAAAATTASASRSLFSNLFLPGNSLATFLRLAFWILLPSPELSVMLLDWSSLRSDAGGVSRIFVPVMTCLLTGNFQKARQLVFAQLLASSSGNSDNSNDNQLVIQRRNEHALQVVRNSLRQQQQQEDGQSTTTTTSLVYGAMHCPDLTRRLVQDGFVPTNTFWRTAWSVQVPSFGTTTTTAPSSSALGVGLVLVPLYLVIGGWDWIATWQDLELSLAASNYVDAGVAEMLYLIRHVAIYIGLAKFVVDWESRDTKLFE